MNKLLFTVYLMLFALVSTAADKSYKTVKHSYAFPDFGHMLSPDTYHGPVFKLSADYPEKLPQLDNDVKNILSIDFKKDWKKYALAVRDYVFKDNINQSDNELSFNFSGKQSEIWFHMPWQHWGPNGREGFHGLTKEGPLQKQVLSTNQTTSTSAYAVGFYNRQGGYAIGQVWKDTSAPDLNYIVKKAFPTGTVVAKFLFTTLSSDEVPYLINPVEWTAYVDKSDIPGNASTPCNNKGEERIRTTVRLLQMDIMIKDPRATDSNAWTFGTFVYNGNLNNKNRWENLQPVGLQWGNDPDITLSQSNPTPTETKINQNLKQTKINTDPSMPAQHLGWNGRLNGPADNPESNCMSCHSTGQYPVVSAIMPFLNKPPVSIPKTGEKADSSWMRWFRNFKTNDAFDEGQAMTTDFSLQLSKSIQNFIEYRSKSEQGYYNVEYWSKGHKVSRGHLPPEKKQPCGTKCCK